MSTANPHGVGLHEMLQYMDNIVIHEAISLHDAKSSGAAYQKYQRNLQIGKMLKRVIYDAYTSQTSLQQLLTKLPS